MANITLSDWISIISLGITLFFTIFTISLSFRFYYLSKRDSERMTDSSNAIKHSVEKLEYIFNLMYHDTFSMIKETVNQLWSKSEYQNPKEIEINRAIEKAKLELQSEFKRQLAIGKDINDNKIKEIIEKSSTIEKDIILDFTEKSIIEMLSENSEYGVHQIVENLGKVGIDNRSAVNALRNLQKKKKIIFNENTISAITKVKLIK